MRSRTERVCEEGQAYWRPKGRRSEPTAPEAPEPLHSSSGAAEHHASLELVEKVLQFLGPQGVPICPSVRGSGMGGSLESSGKLPHTLYKSFQKIVTSLSISASGKNAIGLIESNLETHGI